MAERREEVSTQLAAVRERISRACTQAGRSSKDITLIAVTKTWPTADVALLSELGVTDVGENRDQEARPKHDELGQASLTWHAIGQVQTNKAKSVCSWAQVVHSVDRPSLVTALAKALQGTDKTLGVFLQVSLDSTPDSQRGGCHPDSLLTMAHAIAENAQLKLLGVMGVAPLEGDPQAAFSALRDYSNRLMTDFPSATSISAGMSEDFEDAIKFGATHLRIGSLILGHRR